MKKLSQFTVVNDTTLLNDNSYVVMVWMIKTLPGEEYNLHNLVEINGGMYKSIIVKGYFGNFIKTSNKLLEMDDIRELFPGITFLLPLQYKDRLEFVMYETMDGMCKDCAIFTNDKKEKFNIDDAALEWVVKNRDTRWENTAALN